MKPIIMIYLIVFLISMFEIVLISYMKSPKRLGRVFEKEIANSLKSFEKKGIYGRILRNVYLPKNEYETSEIDVLYITTKGIFVIECKNFKGWIFGKENNNTWTVSLPRGRGKSRKYHFFNPIKQNKSHIKPLQEYLDSQFTDKKIQLYSLVVFSYRSTFKNQYLTSSQLVYHKDEMLNNIFDTICNTDPVLTQVQVESLYEKMKSMTKVDKEIKKQHIKNIQKYKR